MRYTEAFRVLGYEVVAPRSDWSAERDGGVCISIWEKEMHPVAEGRGVSFDTRTDAQPIAGWGRKSGNRRRIKHLSKAVNELNGHIDVVVVHGTPGQGYLSASPWQRTAGWRIIYFDPETGHYAAEVRAS